MTINEETINKLGKLRRPETTPDKPPLTSDYVRQLTDEYIKDKNGAFTAWDIVDDLNLDAGKYENTGISKAHNWVTAHLARHYYNGKLYRAITPRGKLHKVQTSHGKAVSVTYYRNPDQVPSVFDAITFHEEEAMKKRKEKPQQPAGPTAQQFINDLVDFIENWAEKNL